MKIMNLTPNPIHLLINEDYIKLISPEATSAKASRVVEADKTFEEFLPVFRVVHWHLEGLPEWQNGAYYIVDDDVVTAARWMGRRTTDLFTLSDGIYTESNNKVFAYRTLIVH